MASTRLSVFRKVEVRVGMAEDPLAYVIRGVLRAGPTFWVVKEKENELVAALRAHIVAYYVNREDIAAALDVEAEAWGTEAQWQKSDAPFGALTALKGVRAALLGTTEETVPAYSPDPDLIEFADGKEHKEAKRRMTDGA